MRSTWKRIVPVLMVIVILISVCWYLFEYDKEFTQDVLLYQARFFEQHERTDWAEWFYTLAYRHSTDKAAVAIELADSFKAAGNYTKAEYTLSNAIADGGSVDLYIALCKTYIEQDKLLDAVKMLDSIVDPEMKAQIDAIRPAAPVITPAPGYYSQYISLTVESDDTVYLSLDGNYPSLQQDAHSGPVALKSGENTVMALSLGKNGLVSPLSLLGYTISGVIKEVFFVDPTLEREIRTLLQKEGSDAILTDELWSIPSLALPENAWVDDLVYFTGLKELKIDRCTGELSVLSGLKKLERLEISHRILSSADLEIIASLPNLTQLSLSSCSLSNISGLSRAAKLIYLDLNNNSIRDIHPLATLENLEELDLSYNALTGLNALSGLQKLTYLNASCNSLISVAPLASCQNLQHLNVSSNAITSLSGVEGLTKMVHLSASGNQLTEVDELAGCLQLIELDISNNAVLDISSLAPLKELRSLLFAHNQIPSLPDFGKDCSLVLIDGSHNMLQSVDTLSGYESLNTVRMDYNFIGDVNSLALCPNLIQVDVSGNPIFDVSKLQEQSIIVHYTPNLE